VTHFCRAICSFVKAGVFWLNMHKTSLARAKVMNNEDIDLKLLYAYVDQNQMKIYDGRMRRCIGEILFHLGEQHLTEAEEWVYRAIEADDTNGMMFYLG
jgi:hypothetical protein